MAAKGKGKDEKKPEPVYSDVNVCWKREKELAAEAASAGPAQMDDAMKESLTLQINELSSRVQGYVYVACARITGTNHRVVHG